MATIKERIELLDVMHQREKAIMEAKAHDYSGDVDCNRNIKACESVGLCSAEKGVILRLLDKLSRLTTLIEPGVKAKVMDESIDDTISDSRNYLAILQHLIVERRAKG